MKVSQTKSFARLVNRNLMALSKNKVALLLPLIPIVITIIAHIALIDSYLIDYLKSIIPSTLMVSDEKCRVFINNWFSTNFVAIVTITYSMAGGVQAVEDKQYGSVKGILSLPIRRGMISSSYVFSSVILGAVIGIIAFIASLAFLALSGQFLVSLTEVALSVATIILMAIVAGLLSNILASFIKTTGIFNAFITVFSLFFAFSIGAIIPLSSLPADVNNLFFTFAFTEAATLLRSLAFTSNIINLMGYSRSEVYESVLRAFDGEVVFYGTYMTSAGIIVAILINIIALIIAFVLLKSLFILYRTKRVKHFK